MSNGASSISTFALVYTHNDGHGPTAFSIVSGRNADEANYNMWIDVRLRDDNDDIKHLSFLFDVRGMHVRERVLLRSAALCGRVGPLPAPLALDRLCSL
jgi:hypothetical protein